MEIKLYYNNLEELQKEGVYLIRNKDNDLLKIGYCNNLERRLKEIIKSFNFTGQDPQLKIECFIECKHYKELEKYLHNHFEEFRSKNEWFNINDISEVIEVSKKFKYIKRDKKEVRRIRKIKSKSNNFKYYKCAIEFNKKEYNIIFQDCKPYPDITYLNNICSDLGCNKRFPFLCGLLYDEDNCKELKNKKEIQIYNSLNSKYIIQLENGSYISINEFLKPFIIKEKQKEVENIKQTLNNAIKCLNNIDLKEFSNTEEVYNNIYEELNKLYYHGQRKYLN